MLPTVMVAVTSVFAILLRPKELVRFCRERPAIAAISGGALLLAVAGMTWWMVSPAQAAPRSLWPPQHMIGPPSPSKSSIPRETPDFVPTPVEEDLASLATPLVLGRDYSRTSFAGGESPLKLAPLWNFQVDSTMFCSTPLVAGQRIYVAGCTADVASYTGLLVCLDAETGRKIWSRSDIDGTPLTPIFSSPALTQDGKNLLIGEGFHTDHDCRFRCYDAATGEVRWAVKTSLHIESSPAIFGDMAVVGCGAIEGSDGKATGDTGHVLAVRISDGKELWRQPVIDPESSPAIDDQGMVYIGSGFNGSAVVALRSDPDDVLRGRKFDRVAWKTSVPDPVTSAITIAGDLVIAGAGNSDFVYQNPNPEGFVVALDKKTGAIRWKTPFHDAVLGEISCKDGILICPCRTGEVAALNLSDGKLLWSVRISGNAGGAGPAAHSPGNASMRSAMMDTLPCSMRAMGGCSRKSR